MRLDWIWIWYDNLFFPWQGKEISYRDLQFTPRERYTGNKGASCWNEIVLNKNWCVLAHDNDVKNDVCV